MLDEAAVGSTYNWNGELQNRIFEAVAAGLADDHIVAVQGELSTAAEGASCEVLFEDGQRGTVATSGVTPRHMPKRPRRPPPSVARPVLPDCRRVSTKSIGCVTMTPATPETQPATKSSRFSAIVYLREHCR